MDIFWGFRPKGYLWGVTSRATSVLDFFFHFVVTFLLHVFIACTFLYIFYCLACLNLCVIITVIFYIFVSRKEKLPGAYVTLL